MIKWTFVRWATREYEGFTSYVSSSLYNGYTIQKNLVSISDDGKEYSYEILRKTNALRYENVGVKFKLLPEALEYIDERLL